MSIIKVNCVDQTLVFENTPVIASGGLEENFVQFSFCSQWDGFTKTAVFWRSESEVFHNLLDAENSCQVAPEVTASDGVIYFGVFGVDSAGRQRTSEVLTYRIVKGAITEGTVPSDPTPDIYTQLLTKYQEMVEIAEDTRKKEQAFETAMTERQNTFEETLTKKVDDDQGAFEEAMTKDQAAFEQTIIKMIEDGLLPDDSITTEKLKDGVVTAEKIAPGVLIDAFTKTETMTADTAAKFGLDSDAVPDAVLSFLGNYAQHWWRRRSTSGYSLSLGGNESLKLYDTSTTGGTTVRYSDTVNIAEDGTLSLNNPKTTTVNVNNDSPLVGRYFEALENCSFSSGAIYFGVTAPAWDFSQGEDCKMTAQRVSAVLGSTSDWEIVRSSLRNAYPDSGILSGYEYQYICNPLENAVTAPKIATGSYKGTGTGGKDSPKTLTVGFRVKVLIVYGKATVAQNTGDETVTIMIPAAGAYKMSYSAGSGCTLGVVTATDTAVTWYGTFSSAPVGSSLNLIDCDYHYVAIG